MDWEIDAAEKGGYEHFMFKEIMEQPQAIRRAVGPRIGTARCSSRISPSPTTTSGR